MASSGRSFRFKVIRPGDVDGDFNHRATQPGVFFATNHRELYAGEVNTVDPTNETVQTRATLITGATDVRQFYPYIAGNQSGNFEATNAELEAFKLHDLVADPEVPGHAFKITAHGRYSGAGIGPRWRIDVPKFAPANYAGPGSVSANQRMHRNGSGPLKFIERQTADGTTAPSLEQRIRHFYVQVCIKFDEAALEWNNQRWDYENYIANKHIFLAAQSSGQVAMNRTRRAMFPGAIVYYSGSGNTGPGQTPAEHGEAVSGTTLDTEKFTFSSIDTHSPDPIPTDSRLEPFIRRYGWPGAGTLLKESSWSAGTVPGDGVIHKEYRNPRVTGFRASENFIGALSRNHPYGGYGYPGLTGVPDVAREMWFEPNVWYVIELHVSQRFDGLIGGPNGANEAGADFRCWGARLGNAPFLLWDELNSDVSPAFNPNNYYSSCVEVGAQDASFEGQRGWYNMQLTTDGVVLPGGDIQFRAAHFWRAPASSQRYGNEESQIAEYQGDLDIPGQWDDMVMGFNTGVARDAPEDKPHPDLPNYQWCPYVIVSSDPTGNFVAIDQRIGEPESREWEFVVRGPVDIAGTPISFRAGDRFAIKTYGYASYKPDRHIWVGPVIASFEPIPFPGHLSTPLPEPVLGGFAGR